MSDRRRLRMADLVFNPEAGVSVNSSDRPAEGAELGVLKTSAVTLGTFDSSQNKVVRPDEVSRVRVSPRADSVIVSRMNTVAHVGASAYVPRDFPNLFLPDRLWLLRPKDSANVHMRWLSHWLAAPATRTRLSLAATGTSGSMKNISKETLLSLEIDLPPLPHQVQVADDLDVLDRAIATGVAVNEKYAVLRSALHETLVAKGTAQRARWSARPLTSLVEQVRRPVSVDPRTMYREVGVRSHGKGLLNKDEISGQDLGSKRVFWVEPNCLIFNIVFAWEGAVSATSADESGLIVSHRFPMFRPLEGVELDFLRLYFQSQTGTRLLASLSPGGAGRNRTLNQSRLLECQVPVPSREEQREIVSAMCALDAVIARQHRIIETQRIAKVAIAERLLRSDTESAPSPERAA